MVVNSPHDRTCCVVSLIPVPGLSSFFLFLGMVLIWSGEVVRGEGSGKTPEVDATLQSDTLRYESRGWHGLEHNMSGWVTIRRFLVFFCPTHNFVAIL